MAAGNQLTSFDQDKLTECLTKQLSEIELFQTMYSPKELHITNPSVIECMQKFVNKETDYMPNHLDYTIKHCIEKIKVEISVNLPSMYPEVAPELYVRCNQLNGQQEKNLNTELTAYLQDKHDDEVCIYTAISWLQDNVHRFAVKTPTVTPAQEETVVAQKFCRYWVYSHHIFSRKKIEEVTKHAKDLNLTGFCLVGKPGIMCIEGNEEECKEWWKEVKALNWQKIALRITEVFKPDERKKQQKFRAFEVIKFSSPVASHSNLGSFNKYMEKHGLLPQANQLIGLYLNN